VFYLDTSSLLKLLLPEPESARVQEAVAEEDLVLVSSLAELEAEVQLRAGWLGGTFRPAQYHRLTQRLRALLGQEPFQGRLLPGTLFRTALQQHLAAPRLHVRTLDRLHLAAMQELDVHRLMTHDQAQALAARSLGYEVLTPA
jgi:predicted nucleic acid-binding protein